MKTPLRVAWIAMAAPLLVGTAIFIMWLIFRLNVFIGDVLMDAGVVTIFAGLISVTIGLIGLAVYLWHNWRLPEVSRLRLLWQTTSLIALFLANFVAAGSYIFAAAEIETRYHLSITNGSDEPLRNVRVGVWRFSVDFGDIPAGETRRKNFGIGGEGELILTATQGEQQIEAVVDGYVTPNLGGDVKVTVNSSGEVVVENLRSGLMSHSHSSSAHAP